MNNPLERSKPLLMGMQADARKRNLIDTAAQLLGTVRTGSNLDAACKRAEEMTRDRRLFMLSEEAFELSEKALDANPLRRNECLQELMSRPRRY